MSTSAAQVAAFLKEARARGQVWTVKDEQGIPAPRTGQGDRAMPFWASRSRAERVVATVPAYGSFGPLSIELSEFRQRAAEFEPGSASSGRYAPGMVEPTHQVVVQFPEAAVPDFDTLSRSEELLITLLGDAHIYDGVHIGAGTVNFYILTADRAAVLLAIQGYSDWLAHPDIRIAARRLDADSPDYRPLWPQGDRRDFRLFYGPPEATTPAWRSQRVAETAAGLPANHSPSPAPEGVFLPLTEGRVEGTAYQHRVQHLGQLRLPTGRLQACDPFVNMGQGPVIDVPPGDYHVYVTVADVSDEQDWRHPREAYLSVVIDEAEPSTFSFLTPVGNRPPEGGEFYGVGVDAGTVAFVDSIAVSYAMPEPDTWYDDVFDSDREDSWFALMDSDEHLIPGCANVVMPRAGSGENVVMCHSGWGDGFYPLVGSFDARGRLVAVHIDLEVDEAEDGPIP